MPVKKRELEGRALEDCLPCESERGLLASVGTCDQVGGIIR